MSSENVQQELPYLGLLDSKLDMFSDDELDYAKTLTEAYWITIKLSKKPRKAIEAECGIQTPQMSRILAGSRNLPSRAALAFYKACGNVYALQWQLRRLGFSVSRRELTKGDKAKLFDQMMQERRAG